MTPFVTLAAAGLPIAQPNFDTDQVIPGRFLSRPRELGLAECLFHDVRRDAEGALRPEWQPASSSIHLVSPPARRNSAKVRAFVEFAAVHLA